MTAAALLRVERIDVAYGRLTALRGVSLDVAAGQIVALLGSNGAGKSTLLKAVSGLVAPTAGSIRFGGEEIAGRRPSALVRRGLVHAAERRPLFGDFTLEENLEVGAWSLPRGRVREALEEAYASFPILRERRRQRAATLSGGEQQMLVIARALMTRPRLLLLDEPSLGLAPMIVQAIYEQVARISRERGLAVLVAEPNVDLALGAAAHGYVLETGSVVASGPAAVLRADDEVRQSYLGERVGAR
jgi:branched-chain amino acid transport system ATP-binding protein